MTRLINCIECGREMSSGANRCPHCKTDEPLGAICAVCNKHGRASNMKDSTEHGQYKAWVHEACLAEITQCQYSCPVCKNPITTHNIDKCNKCGHPISRSSCAYCGRKVIEKLALKLSASENSKARYRYHYGVLYAHKVCYSSHTSSSCFIATAAFGSSFAPEVTTLRSFRDTVLKKYHFGRNFISLYESVSPPIANIIARNDVLRYLTRILIVYPAAWLAKLVLMW
jgi:hypothetical protein